MGRALRRAIRSRIIALYALSIAALSALSYLTPYQTQVHLSIVAGFAIALLIPLSMILSRGLEPLDAIFIAGVAFLIVALLKSDLPTRAVLESLRHFSLILSFGLSALYAALRILRSYRAGSATKSMDALARFFSIFNATLSSELCSCLHPTLFLEALGISASIQSQVRLGFIIMMATLLYQARLTHGSYRSRRGPSKPL
ncbi:MAG: hypothetical protein QXQ76_02000 [Candidatus Bathyarchaeia archaeon]